MSNAKSQLLCDDTSRLGAVNEFVVDEITRPIPGIANAIASGDAADLVFDDESDQAAHESPTVNHRGSARRLVELAKAYGAADADDDIEGRCRAIKSLTSFAAQLYRRDTERAWLAFDQRKRGPARPTRRGITGGRP